MENFTIYQELNDVIRRFGWNINYETELSNSIQIYFTVNILTSDLFLRVYE